jgi:hypothetical protein
MEKAASTQRSTPLRHAPRLGAPLRSASLRRASQHNATFHVSTAAHRCAPPHCATRRDSALRPATQLNATFSLHRVASRHGAAQRRASPRTATPRFAPLRDATHRSAPQHNTTQRLFLEELQMLFETSEETLHLRAFLAAQPPGARLTYAGIEEATGITMDDTGRGKLRRAAAREGLPYDTLIGMGIELASPGNGVHIIGGRLERIRHAITRTERTHANIQARFLHEMSKEDQKRCVYVGVIFSAMHAAAERVKGLHMKIAPRKLGNT